ncbi:response regulator transcription factor [Candidatus Binatia bacterium]|jgi:two-component system response regulator FixJ|nr:response regulator transcription factor [Candidatus Binatia bacterium]
MESHRIVRASTAAPGTVLGVATEDAPILLAEDDGELRALIAHALREAGHAVLEASNGFELLDRIEAAIAWGEPARPPISLIISDVRMPGMTGVDVLSVLRCAYWATPVILMSAFADATLRSEAWELGAAAVIAKPFAMEELLDAARVALRRSAGGTRKAGRLRAL